MSLVLSRVLEESVFAGDPIKVDIDALWRKAIDASYDKKKAAQHKAIDPSKGLGEFAVISAWARAKGKKG